MNRELALKIAPALVGLLFIALVYPMVVFMRQAPVRHTGRLSAFSHPQSIGESQRDCLYRMVEFRHAALMGTQAFRNMVVRGELIGVAVLMIISVVLIELAPSKQLLASASHANRLTDGRRRPVSPPPNRNLNFKQISFQACPY